MTRIRTVHAGQGGGGAGSVGTWPRISPGAWYFLPDNGANNTISVVQNRLYAAPFISPVNGSIAQLAVQVTTAVAATTIRLGLYAATEDYLPGDLLEEIGSGSGASTGMVAVSPTAELVKGELYFAAVVCQGGTPTLRSRTAANSLIGSVGDGSIALENSYQIAAVSGALPSTYGTPAGSTGGPALSFQF